MKILISGGTGFIGQALVSDWLAASHQVVVLTRQPEKIERLWPQNANVTGIDDLNHLDQRFDALVNLAGEGIADRPWRAARVQALYDSRIGVTQRLLAWAEKTQQRFNVVLSGSAIGYYGPSDAPLDEQSPSGQGLAARLCLDWEAAAQGFASLTERLCYLRTGVVLGEGGALSKMLPAFKMGLGGRLGSGQQAFSWVHLIDCIGAIEFLLQHPSAHGAFNLTAPHSVSNQMFTQTLARTLRRPAVLPMPAWALTLLLGKRASLLLDSQAVLPTALLKLGFDFQFERLVPALKDILGD